MALLQFVESLRPLINYTQVRGAARKYIRLQRAREARFMAAKRRLEEKPKKRTHIKVARDLFRFPSDELPPPPEDDVYFFEGYRRQRHSFEECIDFHRQLCHPHVLNLPSSLLSASIELNLKMKIKKKKYIERIESTVCYPNTFKYEMTTRKIIALAKEPADQQAAREAGAFMSGAMDIVTQLKKSQLTIRDFNHIVCHSDFLVDFGAVKGMKGQPYFPSKQRNNFGDNMADLVSYFKNGVDYQLAKMNSDPSKGVIECYFGQLDMTDDQLKANLSTLFEHINRFRPLNLADEKQFFERVIIKCPATKQSFFLKFWEICNDYEDPFELEASNEKTASSASG